MELQRVHDLKSEDGYPIPAYLIVPDQPLAGAAVCHGYGGLKEDMLGLSTRLAEHGIAALAFDLRGHGENQAPIGPEMTLDFTAAIAYVRRFGMGFAVGHSLGGRLALMSDADAVVAVSPAVVQEISPMGRWMFENFPSPTVREPYSGYVVELLEALGEVPDKAPPALVLAGRHDILNIIEGAQELAQRLPQVTYREITAEQRPLVESDHPLTRYLPRWFNHIALKKNAEVLAVAPQWLAQRLNGSA